MSTVINEKLNGVVSSTSVNNSLRSDVLPKGTKVGEYTIIDYISTDSGEANVYLCERESQKYVAKVYKREVAIKKEVIDSLNQINSPYIAKIIEIISYEGFQVEILPYYTNGNLEEKTYSFSELKTKIIPALNEGLRVLHENKIIHKDLKPSNIMVGNNGDTISIIDFGISSVLGGDASVLVTKTGVTFDYAAPETFPPRYLFWEGSDYYSLGLIIYKLYFGRRPFQEINDAEERERFFTSQKLPFNGVIPDELKNLIEALTYIDITHRNEKDNPNRRWTYKEVDNWCKGISQPLPGSSKIIVEENGFKPINFNGNTYTDKKSYIMALLKDWEFGKEKLYRGGLTSMFSKLDDDMWRICKQAEESADDENEDVLFLKTMLKLEKSINQICWKGIFYENIIDLGTKFLNDLQNGIGKMNDMVNTMLESNFFSTYLIMKNADWEKEVTVMKAIETSYKVNKTYPIREYYTLAYALTDQKTLAINGNKFKSIPELEEYLKKSLSNSVQEFENACKGLMNNNGQLNVQFETWLIALGKKEAINDWQREINH